MHQLQLADARKALHESPTVIDLVGLNVDEIEARGFLRQALAHLAGEVAFDEGDGDQHGKAEAERLHHRGGRSTRPVEEIGKRRVGKESVSTCRSRLSEYPLKQKIKHT